MRSFRALMLIVAIASIAHLVTAGAGPSRAPTPEASDHGNEREMLQRWLDTRQAVPFAGLRTMRYAIGASINGKFDNADWLKPAVTAPLQSIGISMIEQVGQKVDTTLSLLAILIDITHSGRQSYELRVSSSLRRRVRLADTPEIAFMTAVWRKDELAEARDLSHARGFARVILDKHVNEFVRYWSIANASFPR